MTTDQVRPTYGYWRGTGLGFSVPDDTMPCQTFWFQGQAPHGHSTERWRRCRPLELDRPYRSCQIRPYRDPDTAGIHYMTDPVASEKRYRLRPDSDDFQDYFARCFWPMLEREHGMQVFVLCQPPAAETVAVTVGYGLLSRDLLTDQPTN
jgi:hypothetical protein